MKYRTVGLLPVIVAFVSFLTPGGVNSANAQADNGKTLVATNVVKLTSAAQVSGSGFFSSVSKQFLVPFFGTVRVKWKVKSGTSGRNASVSASSLLGNCTAGTNLTTTSTVFVAGTCDLRVVAGDIVRVSVSGSAPGIFPDTTPGSTGFMQSVTLSFNVQNGTGLGVVLP